MKILFLLPVTFLFLQCKPDNGTEPGPPCFNYEVPSDWQCEERIGYRFCFPPSFQSELYFWEKDEPYSSFSRGIFDDQAQIMDFDESDFIASPFPEQIDLPDDNVLAERMIICDDYEIIGVFYYGTVNFAEVFEYAGYLYLKSPDDDGKFYYSAFTDTTEESLQDIISIVRRLRKLD